MKKTIRIAGKIIAIVILTGLLIWLIDTDETILKKNQPRGELVQSRDVEILIDELVTAAGNKIDKSVWELLKDRYFTEAQQHITYGTYENLLDCLLARTEEKTAEKLKKKLTDKDKYESDFYLLKEDWYHQFEALLEQLNLQKNIRREKIEILCGNQELVGNEHIGEGCLLSKTGMIYECASEEIKNTKFETVTAYVHENRLLTILEHESKQSVLTNVYILSTQAQKLHFFYKGYEVFCSFITENNSEGGQTLFQEQIADIYFGESEIQDIHLKQERISGKLLTLSADKIEIEGKGSFEVREDCAGYEIFAELKERDVQELTIGYQNTDFVLEDGKICAFLITGRDIMESIRVAIKSNGFQSLYHQKIILSCEDDMTILYGKYGERIREEISGGSEIIIEPGCRYLKEDRMEIFPNTNTGKIRIASLQRSQGQPEYRGRMEVTQNDKGLLLLNEVLLEEYLYSVVPSEMPASYPLEALKAQAICARTYAYRYLRTPGYAEEGAHVDDSVSYQVYNNIAENGNSTKAVRETAGILLLYNEEPADTYYYSTSCGFGTDAGIWNEERMQETPFIQSLPVAQETDRIQATTGKTGSRQPASPQELIQEDIFTAYIQSKDENSYEKEEPWYRWTYEVEKVNTELMYEKLMSRYQESPDKILTCTEKEDMQSCESKKPSTFRKIYDIRCLKRRPGGVLDELLLVTDEGTYKIISEYNIRAVLNQGGEVVRQDGSSVENGMLLPSAYLVIDVVKSGKNVIGYTINGGGYGHGAGMSQNGAKAMGIRGKKYEEILLFFFTGCKTGKIDGESFGVDG